MNKKHRNTLRIEIKGINCENLASHTHTHAHNLESSYFRRSLEVKNNNKNN